MKKIISALLLLTFVLSTTAFAAPVLNEDCIFTDGEYLYTFGSFDKSENPDEVGVIVNGNEYSLSEDMFTWAKTNGKFGIGIKDSENTLGNSYQVIPYTKKDGVVTSGEAITVEKDLPIRNLKYHGIKDETLNTTPYLGNNLKTGTQIFTNMDVFLLDNVHAELKGEQYISIFNPNTSSVNNEIKNDWTSGPMREWFSFDLYKSAEIKIFTKDVFSELTNEKYGFTENTTLENDGFWFSLKHKEWPNSEQQKFANMYSKPYVVEDGGCVRVSLPNLTTYGGLKHWGYFIVIDYLDDEEISPRITNVKYAGPEVEGVTYGFKLNHYLESDSERYVFTNNTDISFNNVDSSLEGNPYITMDNPKSASYNSEIASAWLGGKKDWITFEINSDATIKVITDGTAMDNCSEYGFKKADSKAYFDAYLLKDKANFSTYSNMYYKKVEVEPGETVKVTVPNAPTWTTQTTCKTAHVVVVDFEREYIPEITPVISNVKYAGPESENAVYGVKLNHILKDGADNYVYTNNNEVSFKNVDSSIANKPYITMDNINSNYDATIGNAWLGGSRDWITFDINSSATVKVLTDGVAMDNCSKYGFTKATESKTYFDAYLEAYNEVNVSYTNMYYQHFEVKPDKTVTVKIPNAPTWTTLGSCKKAHVVVIDFDDEYVLPEIVPEVTNAAYAGPEIEGVDMSVELVNKLSENGKAYTDKEDSVVSEIDPLIAGKPYIIMNCIRANKNDALVNAWDTGEKDWIKFNINKSAVIRVFSDGTALANCGKYGFDLSDETKTYLKTTNATYNRMYTKKVEVEYGKTKEVIIPNAPLWYGSNCRWGHIVVIDFID